MMCFRRYIFNTGRYRSLSGRLSAVSGEEQMTPELFALKGRCQVMDGHFSDALRSFDRALKEKAVSSRRTSDEGNDSAVKTRF